MERVSVLGAIELAEVIPARGTSGAVERSDGRGVVPANVVESCLQLVQENPITRLDG